VSIPWQPRELYNYQFYYQYQFREYNHQHPGLRR